jgi:hypothetical protein
MMSMLGAEAFFADGGTRSRAVGQGGLGFNSLARIDA